MKGWLGASSRQFDIFITIFWYIYKYINDVNSDIYNSTQVYILMIKWIFESQKWIFYNNKLV